MLGLSVRLIGYLMCARGCSGGSLWASVLLCQASAASLGPLLAYCAGLSGVSWGHHGCVLGCFGDSLDFMFNGLRWPGGSLGVRVCSLSSLSLSLSFSCFSVFFCFSIRKRCPCRSRSADVSLPHLARDHIWVTYGKYFGSTPFFPSESLPSISVKAMATCSLQWNPFAASESIVPVLRF